MALRTEADRVVAGSRGFVVVVVVLLVLVPRTPASVVFTRFINGGGWNSMGLSLMIGQISAIYALISAFATSLP